MPSQQKTHAQIVAAADAELLRLQAIELRINREIDAIKDKAFTGPLTAADRNEIARLRMDKAPVLDAIEELGFVTLGALDTTDELRRLINSLRAVVADLEKRRARIQRFAEGAQKFASVLTKLQEVADKADGLLGEIGISPGG